MLMLQVIQLVKHCDIILHEQGNSIYLIFYTCTVSSGSKSLWRKKSEHGKGEVYNIRCLILNGSKSLR